MNQSGSLLDPRLCSFGKEVSRWRRHLRDSLAEIRGYSSDLSGVYLHGAFDVHEGIIPRAVVNKGVDWHWMIFHEINCFLLLQDEHIPNPPSRTECYWMAVARYTKPIVDAWIVTLPWKVPLERPWAGTNGVEIIEHLYAEHRMTTKQIAYFRSRYDRLNREA